MLKFRKLRSHKVDLLKYALREGPRAFSHQFFLAARDTFWTQRHLIFYFSPDELAAFPKGVADQCLVRQVPNFSSLPQTLQERLVIEKRSIDWGDPSWFDFGWELWVGEINGTVATFSWLRRTEHSKGFFVAVPRDSVLFWQSATLPEFRGRCIAPSVWLAIIQKKHAEGVKHFFSSCRDYNVASQRALMRAGFRQIGIITRNNFTRQRVWHPTT